MATSDRIPDRGGEHGAAWAGWASKRLVAIDNLKVILIAAVIVGHAILGYSVFDSWSYADVREATLSTATMVVLIAVTAPFGLLVIPLLFLIAGLLTPSSMERKGTGRFVVDRLLRLGVPFIVFALVLWPLLEYGLFRWLNDAPELLPYLLAEGSLDTGVLWFVGALLFFSLAYAAWVAARGRPVARIRRSEIHVGHLLVLAAAAALATFLVRLAVPFEEDNRIVDVNLWEWPACAAMFGLGVVAAREDWLTSVPDRLRRQARLLALIAAAAAGAFAIAVFGFDLDVGLLWGGWHWPALVFAFGEVTLSVFGSLWLLGGAQRLLDRSLPWAGPAVRRSSYGAFLLQGPVLIGLALALRPMSAPAEVKAALVAVSGVVASWALARLLLRVPGMPRIL